MPGSWRTKLASNLVLGLRHGAQANFGEWQAKNWHSVKRSVYAILYIANYWIRTRGNTLFFLARHPEKVIM